MLGFRTMKLKMKRDGMCVSGVNTMCGECMHPHSLKKEQKMKRYSSGFAWVYVVSTLVVTSKQLKTLLRKAYTE